MKQIYGVFSYYFDVDRVPELLFYKSKQSYEVVILDLTEIFSEKNFYGISRKEIYSSNFKIIKITSTAHFTKFIEKNEAFFFLYLTDRIYELKLWYLLRKKTCFTFDYSIFNKDDSLLRLKKISFFKIKEKLNNLVFNGFLKTFGPDHYISTTKSSSRSKHKMAIIDIHPILSYIQDDIYYKKKKNKKNVLIILGNFLFDDYDFKRCGEIKPDFSAYFDLLRRFLEELKINHFNPIIIFHPKTKWEFTPAWTKKFEHKFGIIPELLLGSQFVIGHFSSTLIAAQEFGLPVVILNSNNFKNSPWIQGQISEFSKIIGIHPLMLENLNGLINLCKEISGKINDRVEQNIQFPFYNLSQKIEELSQIPYKYG